MGRAEDIAGGLPKIHGMRWYLPDGYPIFWHEVRRRLMRQRAMSPLRRIMLTVGRDIGIIALVAIIITLTVVSFVCPPEMKPMVFWFILLVVAIPLAVISPSLSAWVVAEEREKGTFEVLLTLPVPSRSLVLQKYGYIMAMALGIFALFLPCTLPMLIRDPLLWFSGYAAALTAIACFLACGLLMGTLYRFSWLASLVSSCAVVLIVLGLGMIFTINPWYPYNGSDPWMLPFMLLGTSVVFGGMAGIFLLYAVGVVERMRNE